MARKRWALVIAWLLVVATAMACQQREDESPTQVGRAADWVAGTHVAVARISAVS